MAALRSRRDVARMLREDSAPPILEHDAFVAVLAAQARATAMAVPAVPPRRLVKLVAAATAVAACTVGVAVAANQGLFPAPAPEQAPPAVLPSDSSEPRPVNEGVELDEEQEQEDRDGGRTGRSAPAGDHSGDPAETENSSRPGPGSVGSPTDQQPAAGGSQHDEPDQDGPRDEEPGETPDDEAESEFDDEAEPESESDDEAESDDESGGSAEVEGSDDPEDPEDGVDSEDPEQQPSEPADGDAAEPGRAAESS